MHRPRLTKWQEFLCERLQLAVRLIPAHVTIGQEAVSSSLNTCLCNGALSHCLLAAPRSNLLTLPREAFLGTRLGHGPIVASSYSLAPGADKS